MSDILLATVVATYEDGVQLLINGEQTPTQKKYKCQSGFKPIVGDVVCVAQIGGSYVVLGSIGNPTQTLVADTSESFVTGHTGSIIGFFGVTPVAKTSVANVTSGATLSTAVSKLNELLDALQAYGLV